MTGAPETAERRRVLEWEDPMASAARGLGMSGLEYLEAIAAGEIPPPPIAVTMRLGPIEVAEGRAVFEGHPGEEHYNPIGMVHGGYAATILDSALGCAVQTTLPAGHAYSTLSLEVKYLRAVTSETGRVLAAAEVVHRGRTQATAQARLEDENGRLLATATTTCILLSPPEG